MQFEVTQYPEMMGSLNIDKAFHDKHLFGSQKESVNAVVQQALLAPQPSQDPISDLEASNEQLSELFTSASKTADKLRSLRKYSSEILKASKQLDDTEQHRLSVQKLDQSLADLSVKAGLPSNRQLHESLLVLTRDTKGFPRDAQAVLDHAMLLRAKEKYLFDYAANTNIVSDDPWLQELWDWVAGMYTDFVKYLIPKLIVQ